jgi:hypothetical protein
MNHFWIRIWIRHFYPLIAYKLSKSLIPTLSRQSKPFMDPEVEVTEIILTKREHPVLHKMKLMNFFLFRCVIFDLLDADRDPLTWLNPDPEHCLTPKNPNSLRDWSRICYSGMSRICRELPREKNPEQCRSKKSLCLCSSLCAHRFTQTTLVWLKRLLCYGKLCERLIGEHAI